MERLTLCPLQELVRYCGEVCKRKLLYRSGEDEALPGLCQYVARNASFYREGAQPCKVRKAIGECLIVRSVERTLYEGDFLDLRLVNVGHLCENSRHVAPRIALVNPLARELHL